MASADDQALLDAGFYMQRRIPSHITEVLRAYFRNAIHRDAVSGDVTLCDIELGSEASDCSTLQVAGFLATYSSVSGGHLDDDLYYSESLIERVASRSGRDSWFSIPYNVAIGENGPVDVAEFGASIDSVYAAVCATQSSIGRELMLRMGAAVLLRASDERPGAFYKNRNVRHLDVLNGDLYAALVVARCYVLTNDVSYLKQVERTVEHLISRFGVHNVDGWSYSEEWDGYPTVGYSLAYQATIVGWGSALLPIIDSDLASRWRTTLQSAFARIESDIDRGPCVDTEAPTWSRDWNEVWEIYLAVSRASETVATRQYLVDRAGTLSQGVIDCGMGFLSDHRPVNVERTPIGTTMRKAANLAAIITASDFTVDLI